MRMGHARGYCAPAVATFIVVLLLVPLPLVVAVEHVVGGSSGWTTSVDYTTWAAGETFLLRDTLLFRYDSMSHTVEEVDKDGYDKCDATKATDSFQDGNTTIALTKTGPMFFICATAGHCAFQGMKLTINVKASTGGRSPPPTTASRPTSTSTSTPAAPPTSPSAGPVGSPSPRALADGNGNGPAPTGPNKASGLSGKWSCLTVVFAVMFALGCQPLAFFYVTF